MRKILGMVLLLMLLAGAAQAVDISWQWTAPVTGTTPVTYAGTIEFYPEDDPSNVTTVYWENDTADTVFTWTDYELSTFVRVNVYAIDARGTAGEVSEWSDLYINHGQPGVPGKPEITF